MTLPEGEQPLLGKENNPLELSEHDILIGTNTFDNGTIPSASYGYFLSFWAAIALAVCAFLFHIAEVYYDISPVMAVLIASTISVLLSVCALTTIREPSCNLLPPDQCGVLAARGMFAAANMYLKNVSLAYIPVGTALTLLSITPIFVSLLAALFLGDPLTATDVLVLLANVVGVVLVSRPTQLGGLRSMQLVGTVAGLCAALCAAVGYTLVKRMGLRVHYLLNPLAIGLSGLLLSAFATPISELRGLSENMLGVAITALASCLGFASQALVNRGMQLCRPGPSLVIRSCNVPVSFALGLFFLNERVSGLSLLGVVIVLVSVCYLGISQMLRDRTGGRS